MIRSITSRVSALLLATITVTLAGTIATFGGSLVVLGLFQTASVSSYANAAPLRLVNWTMSPSGRFQNP